VPQRLLVGALLAAKSFDEPHKSLTGGLDIGVRNDVKRFQSGAPIEPTRSHAT
jgi:hypothetical protein